MNYTVIFVLVISLLPFSHTLTSQREPLRGPTGRLLNSRSRESSVKGKGGNKEPSSQTESPIDKNDCDASKDYVEEVVNSFNQLGSLTHQKWFTFDEQKQFTDYCGKATKLVTKIDSEIYCLDGKQTKAFLTIGNGWQRSVRKKCKSEIWRKKYLQYSDCINKDDVHEKVKACSAKEYSALTYILKNIPRKDQLKTICCYQSILYRCVRTQTTAVCGQKTGEYVRDSYLEPRTLFVEDICSENFRKHCSAYSKATEKFNEIFESKGPEKYGSIFKPLYKIVKNSIDIDEI